jgi:XTP/dITP diphosphohydrolase
MKKLLIATHNYGKFKEIEAILCSLPLELVNLNDVNIEEDVEETGLTYEENAIIKARFFAEKSGLPTIADDSGITVDALKNELGVKTRRWGAGAQASDEEWLDFFMNRMKDEKNRNTTFYTTIAFLEKASGKAKIFTGKCEGTISKSIEAEYLKGIPLSAVFKPNGLNCVYSALNPEEKGKISHRGMAANKLKDFLKG